MVVVRLKVRISLSSSGDNQLEMYHAPSQNFRSYCETILLVLAQCRLADFRSRRLTGYPEQNWVEAYNTAKMQDIVNTRCERPSRRTDESLSIRIDMRGRLRASRASLPEASCQVHATGNKSCCHASCRGKTGSRPLAVSIPRLTPGLRGTLQHVEGDDALPMIELAGRARGKDDTTGP